MADGIPCTKCGYQETTHLYPEYADADRPPCAKYDDGIKHKRGCPKEGCMGDCDDTIARKKAADKEQQRKWDAIEH